MRPAAFTMAAIAEAETGQAVNPGAGQDRAGCSQGGQPGNGALQRHESPVKRVAYSGGSAPAPPKSRRAEKVDQRIAAVTASLKDRREQGKQPGMRHKSRDWVVPLDLCDTPGDKCGCGAVGWVAEGGRITARYRPGRKKGCPVCGRQLRARYWQGYGPILEAAGEELRRLECSEADWKRLQRRLRKDDHQALPIPVEGGRVVWTTAPVGEPVGHDLKVQLAADLLVMADDARRMRATGSKERPGWRQQWQAFLAAEEAATPAPTGEYLGFSGADSIPRARMWAQHFGILERELDGEGLVVRDVRESDPATWYLFAERVGIRKWARGGEAARAA